MRLHMIEYSENLDTEKVQELVMSQDIVMLKGLFSRDLLQNFRLELISWREQTDAHDPNDHYPQFKRNLHLIASNNNRSIEQAHIDYHENYTLLDAYNYRIGDFTADEVGQYLPSMREIGPKALRLYQNVLKNPIVQHGTPSGRNLFFEIPHYLTNSGFIEPHTHQANFEFGQTINMVTLMSEKGEDYENGGLCFERAGIKINTSDVFKMGDAVLFRNDTVHWVEKVVSDNPAHLSPHKGRWTMGLFFY
jgi:hypothetical protein